MTKQTNQSVEEKDIPDSDNKLIAKGDVKVETKQEVSLSGKTVKVELDGVTYEAVIK